MRVLRDWLSRLGRVRALSKFRVKLVRLVKLLRTRFILLFKCFKPIMRAPRVQLGRYSRVRKPSLSSHKVVLSSSSSFSRLSLPSALSKCLLRRVKFQLLSSSFRAKFSPVESPLFSSLFKLVLLKSCRSFIKTTKLKSLSRKV